MDLSRRQINTLTAMGIDLWQQRVRAQLPTEQSKPATTLADQLAQHGVSIHAPATEDYAQLTVVGEWHQEDEQAQTVFAGACGELFEAMLKAIRLTRAQIELIGLSRPDAGDGQMIGEVMQSGTRKVVLWMRSDKIETASFDRLDGATLIATVHPRMMLENAELKRCAWEDLKRVRSMLD
ncbi:MAG: hypothetical protein AAF434_16705 [Pseudomonadota bacterium]